MWWFDFKDDVLAQSGWLTLKAPFDKFTLSYGDGNRRKNKQQDLDKIIGTEINLISKSEEHPQGTIWVEFFRPYKD